METNDNRAKEGKSWADVIFRETLIPLFLMCVTPNFAVCVTYLVVDKKSDVSFALSQGFLPFWRGAWSAACIGDREAWTLVLSLAVWAALSVLCLGGKKYHGPPTSTGFRPEYVDSGFRYYVLTVTLTIAALCWPGLVPAWYLYKKMVSVAGALVVFGLLVCLFLYVKGSLFPSSGEHGSSRNVIFDFYWGQELYPRLGGRRFDMKMWTNCRFGMMAWQLLVLLCWKAQLDTSGWRWAMAASSLLQTIYIFKFYWWEEGYMKTIDIVVDRAGFYICWGCICFVPTFYTLTSLYMVENTPYLNFGEFLVFFALGLATVALNYMADRQKQLARDTDGNCIIWGQPASVIRATYTDCNGKSHQTILLASGFWSLSRHMNYVFEIAASFMWIVPSLFSSFLPYSYCLFVSILLVHRSFRDDHRCRSKYGSFWEEYCKICRYRLLPGLF